MGMFKNDDVVGRIKDQVYKLKHRRIEGFLDKSLLSACLINEIKYLFSLLEIGEFEEATPYLNELETRDIIDPTTEINITKHTGESLEARIKTFKSHNQTGIKCFEAGKLEEALDSFDKALILEPLNSGALLNRSQVLISILQHKVDRGKERDKLIKQCQNSFSLLSNTHLPENHANRLSSLLIELREVKN